MLCFMLVRWGGYIVVLGIQTQKRKVSNHIHHTELTKPAKKKRLKCDLNTRARRQ